MIHIFYSPLPACIIRKCTYYCKFSPLHDDADAKNVCKRKYQRYIWLFKTGAAVIPPVALSLVMVAVVVQCNMRMSKVLNL